ncbi:hypothetical protein TKK_0019036 [Trichogramma kaykai]
MIFNALIFVAGIVCCSCEFLPSFEEYVKTIKSDPLFVNNVLPPGLNWTETFANRPLRSYEKVTVPELIEYHGHKAEIHHVTTKDGYILEIHRHGILTSSIDWILVGPRKALGFLLADAGYDVWMENSRGNVYSRKHVKLSPDDHDFWRIGVSHYIEALE